jgi:DNA-directed RNA polymerase specialized sigma24 family protein
MWPSPVERTPIPRPCDTYPTDSDLLAGLRSGDVSAFGSLFARYWSVVADMARAQRCPAGDVDDVAAEVLERVRAASARGTGPTRHLRGYLRSTTRSVLVDRSRSRRRRGEVSDDVLLDHEAAAPPAAGDDRMAAALATLAPHWQRLLWRLDVTQESTSEVAAAIGSTPAAVSAMAYRAHLALREAYLTQTGHRA